MKSIRLFCWGMLFGFVAACVIFLAPLTGPQIAAKAWAMEEILFNSLPSVFPPGTTSGMLAALVFHFAFWPLMGGLIFCGVALLRGKVLQGDTKGNIEN